MINLTELIANTYGFAPESGEFGLVMSATMRYVTGCIDAYKFQAELKQVVPNKRTITSPKKFRMMLKNDGYYATNMRFYASRLAQLRSVDAASVNALRHECRIASTDAKWSTVWFLNDSDLRRSLKAHFKGVDLSAFSLTAIHKQLERVLARLMKHVRCEVHKRIRFLVREENCEASDLHNLVLAQVLPSFFLKAPFNSDEHALNFLKQYVSSRVHNVREFHQRSKRARLVCVGLDAHGERQFLRNSVSENQLNAHNSDEDSEVSVDTLASTNMDAFELRFSVEQLVGSIRSKYGRLIISVLMGMENEKFTSWLRQHKHAGRGEDSLDVQGRVAPATFNGYVRSWLGIAKDKFDALIDALKKRLGSDSQEFCYV